MSVTVKGPVTVSPDAPDDGMVMDFGDLKMIVQREILDVFDHALVLNERDQRREMLGALPTKMIVMPFQPTSENLILEFVERVRSLLQNNVRLVRMKLRETPTSFAEWIAEDNP